MDHPLRLDRFDDVRPWRTATLLLVGVAVVELVLLIVVGGALLAKPDAAGATARHAAVKGPEHAKADVGAAKAKPARPSPAAELPRRRVSVLVLNGNGRQGAAAIAAQRVSRRGYRVESVANAGRSDFRSSLVMYRRGFEGEGRRLARDLRVHLVGPLDGMRPSQLHGAHAVFILGR